MFSYRVLIVLSCWDLNLLEFWNGWLSFRVESTIREHAFMIFFSFKEALASVSLELEYKLRYQNNLVIWNKVIFWVCSYHVVLWFLNAYKGAGIWWSILWSPIFETSTSIHFSWQTYFVWWIHFIPFGLILN